MFSYKVKKRETITVLRVLSLLVLWRERQPWLLLIWFG